MSSYYQTMEQFLEMQQDVMQAYLGGRGMAPAPAAPPAGPAEVVPAPSAPPVAPAPVTPAPPVSSAAPASQASALSAAPAAQASAPAASSASAASASQASAVSASSTTPLDADAISARLLKIVADRTGYPPDMIDLDLDLEADLGIDSIKRVEILGSFQQQTGLLQEHDMEALAGRKTLRQVAEFLVVRAGEAPPPASVAAPRPASGGEPSAPPAEAAPPGPLLGDVVSHTPGQQLVTRRDIRLDEDRFLRDHTLGRDVSSVDLSLAGLPVMPMTMSMEILAEAAVALVPGLRLVGMRDVRAYRWMSLEGETLSLRTVATVRPGTEGREVSVQVFEAGPDGAATTPAIVEGIMVLGDALPEPPPVEPFRLAGDRPSKWAPDDLYREMMFHGPAFRGVVSMDRWGEDGAEATLQVLGPERLFASTTKPALVTDPVLMDQPGQVVGFWMPEHLETSFVVFPFHLEALHLYEPRPVAPERLKCQARIALVGDTQVRSDLDIVDGTGRLRTRFVGWWDRRFDLPKAFLRFLNAPRDVVLSQPWPGPTQLAEAGLRAHRLGLDAFPPSFFTAHGGVWQRALAQLVLSVRERELWHELRKAEPRRLEWLIGRVVAKDALRVFLMERHGLRLAPADVEILPDENGRPVPAGAWTRDVPAIPVLSLSHASGVAVAVVAEGGSASGVGVDLEHAARMNDSIEDLAFTTGEHALLAAIAERAEESWPLRLWCAKEAAAKALGLGMAGGPRGLVADRLDPVSGTVELHLSGEMAARFPAVNGQTLVAHTTRERDVIVATSLYPRQ
jgi:phosphopantetheinyl transferase/acyl carrier protein